MILTLYILPPCPHQKKGLRRFEGVIWLFLNITGNAFVRLRHRCKSSDIVLLIVINYRNGGLFRRCSVVVPLVNGIMFCGLSGCYGKSVPLFRLFRRFWGCGSIAGGCAYKCV